VYVSYEEVKNPEGLFPGSPYFFNIFGGGEVGALNPHLPVILFMIESFHSDFDESH